MAVARSKVRRLPAISPTGLAESSSHFSKHGLTNQFTAVGYGPSQPLSGSEKRAGLQRNRRIELRVKGQPEL